MMMMMMMMMTPTEGLKIRDSLVTATLRYTTGAMKNARVLTIRGQK
jgi:hypothetical protein